MVAVMVVVGDEAPDIGLEITRQEVVLQGLMPPLDLALCLWVIGSAAHVIHTVVIQPSTVRVNGLELGIKVS